jgi:hypothetical protein
MIDKFKFEYVLKNGKRIKIDKEDMRDLYVTLDCILALDSAKSELPKLSVPLLEPKENFIPTPNPPPPNKCKCKCRRRKNEN